MSTYPKIINLRHFYDLIGATKTDEELRNLLQSTIPESKDAPKITMLQAKVVRAEWEEYIKDNREKTANNIKKWFQSDPKLPVPSDSVIMKHVYATKNDEARARKALCAYYYMRASNYELCGYRDPHSEEFKEAYKRIYVFSLPFHNEKYQRCTVVGIRDYDVGTYTIEKYAILAAELGIYRMNYDYSLNELVIIDLAGYTPQHLMQTNLLQLRVVTTYLEQAFPHKSSDVHFINCQPFANKLFLIMKTMLKGQGLNIYTHLSESETLFDHISKEYLPEDFGGTKKSLAYYADLWLKELQNNSKELLEEEIKLQQWYKGSNGDVPPEFQDLYGLNGSFKQLNID